jgi:hypothetical protein
MELLLIQAILRNFSSELGFILLYRAVKRKALFMRPSENLRGEIVFPLLGDWKPTFLIHFHFLFFSFLLFSVFLSLLHLFSTVALEILALIAQP